MRVTTRRVTDEEIIAELRAIEARKRKRESWWVCRLEYLRTVDRNQAEQRELENLCKRAAHLIAAVRRGDRERTEATA